LSQSASITCCMLTWGTRAVCVTCENCVYGILCEYHGYVSELLIFNIRYITGIVNHCRHQVLQRHARELVHINYSVTSSMQQMPAYQFKTVQKVQHISLSLSLHHPPLFMSVSIVYIIKCSQKMIIHILYHCALHLNSR
jgi:hypothetical protein